MTRVMKKTIFAACLVLMAVGQVSASDPTEVRDRKPGYALAAAAMNVLYVPVRLTLTVIGAELSGVTGLLTAGNQEAAGDVASVFDGAQFLTPEHVEGSEPLRFGPPAFP